MTMIRWRWGPFDKNIAGLWSDGIVKTREEAEKTAHATSPARQARMNPSPLAFCRFTPAIVYENVYGCLNRFFDMFEVPSRF